VVRTASPSVARGRLAPPPLLVGPGLHTTPDHAFVDAGGNEVQLRGLNLVPVWRDSPGRTWEQARYDQIAAKGFNAVRLVLYWRDFEPQRGSFDQTSLQTLDTAIARAKAAGLRVILDEIHVWGADGGLQDVPAWARTGDSVDTVNANGAGLVRMLAARYRDEPAVAAYDPVNEPHRFPIDPNGVLRMYDGLIRQIRAVDPYKIILVEPAYGDTSALGDDVDFGLLSDRRNVVWAPHDYFAGGDANGYDAMRWQRGTYVWDGRSGYAAPNRDQLAAHLEVQLDAADGAALPVWIGEFGIAADAPNRDAWIADQVAIFRRHGLGYAWWEYHTTGAFSATAADFSWRPWVDLLVG
jgi:endoglycosylceramidase